MGERGCKGRESERETEKGERVRGREGEREGGGEGGRGRGREGEGVGVGRNKVTLGASNGVLGKWILTYSFLGLCAQPFLVLRVQVIVWDLFLQAQP